MGDDPFVPVSNSVAGGSSNANNYFITNIGKPSLVIMVVSIGLALGLSVGAVVMMSWGMSAQRDQMTALIEASERRTMDRAMLAEREARIAQDKYTYTMGELAKQGIKISTDGH